ncbi:hypothetical protein CEE44_05100 [Candidatus Woesearchaeota archaeon B3_Woes]|nr:MAG: hypothetical protein CEE44_05100 [Candidatus Woesearchaeota archaeon B3_Woes]
MVKKENVEDVKNLSPEERIRRLKSIEEKNKQEIEQAQKLIKESEEEIKIEEKIQQVEIPDNKEVNVTNLFQQEESLEETVEREKPQISEEELKQQQDYLRELPTNQLEQKAEYIQQRVEETGYVSNEQRNEITNMYQELKQREDGLKQGSYRSSSQNIEEQISMTKKILGDMYKR